MVTKGDKANAANCSAASCAHVSAKTAGFTGAVTCSVADSESAFGVTWQQGASETKQSPNYYGYPGNIVSVTCSANGQTAVGSLTW